MACSICRQIGHTKRACKAIVDVVSDRYTPEILKSAYQLYSTYEKGMKELYNTANLKIRNQGIPGAISENIIKFIIIHKLKIPSTWDKKSGDLFSEIEGKQECKCFTSDGPISFTPTSSWDVIYFLDARQWLDGIFILYRCSLKRTSDQWKNIKVSETQTMGEQSDEKRRPRITWDALKPQILSECVTVFEGTFDEIFIPREVAE